MCCGDQTIVKVDEALINSKILSIAANVDTICKHLSLERGNKLIFYPLLYKIQLIFLYV